jgi:hypothetical protein
VLTTHALVAPQVPAVSAAAAAALLSRAVRLTGDLLGRGQGLGLGTSTSSDASNGSSSSSSTGNDDAAPVVYPGQLLAAALAVSHRSGGADTGLLAAAAEVLEHPGALAAPLRLWELEAAVAALAAAGPRVVGAHASACLAAQVRALQGAWRTSLGP